MALLQAEDALLLMIPLPPLKDRGLGETLQRQAAASPRALMLEFVAHRLQWTYGDFSVDARRVAAGLQELGLILGDRVGIMLPNRPENVLTWFGSLSAGMVDVAVNHALRGPLLVHQLRTSSVKAIVCDAESSQAVQDVAHDVPSLRILVSVAANPTSTRTLRGHSFSRLSSASPCPVAATPPMAVASVRYTSGTTGPAKAVALPHSHMTAFAAHFAALMDYGVGDRLYTCFPLHHSLASMVGVIPSLLVGACCVIDERFSASRYWTAIRDSGATHAHIIPPLLLPLLARPARDQDGDHGCRRLWTAFTHPGFETRFRTTLVAHYGMTEGGVIAYQPPGQVRDLACGKVNPRYELKIVDESGDVAPAGVRGEILWRPKEPGMMMAGYLGDPDATVRAWRDLWFHSGDEGVMDSDGYVYLIGRIGDQIRRKGVNIAAEDVEQAASRFPGVVEVAAIAVPAEVGESEVKLCVVVRDPPPLVSDLDAYLRANLPPEMCPRFIELRSTPLPRTDTHKVSKALLRNEGDRGITEGTVDLRPPQRTLKRDQGM